MDFEHARQQMVDCQIRPNDVTDYDIISAFLSTPREQFVPTSKRAIAYVDKDLSLNNEGAPRFLGQVTPFSKMLQAASIATNEVVLIIGAGCGYSSAVISKLASSVIGVETDPTLVSRATDALEAQGADNVAIVSGELTEGYASEAPFNVIFIDGAVEEVPTNLFNQLTDGGRLVCVEGRNLAATICVYHKRGTDISVAKHANMAVPMLPGFEKHEEFSF